MVFMKYFSSFNGLVLLPWLLLTVLVAYVWAFEPFDWHAAWAEVKALPGLLWLELLAVFVLSYSARIARWALFTHALGVQVTLWRNAVIYMAGFGMSLVLNKVGEAVGRGAVTARHEAVLNQSLPNKSRV
jgi:hypothetical protein